MRYISNYRVHDPDDKGTHVGSGYLLINSVGFYEVDEPLGATVRKGGRRDYYLSYNHTGRMKFKAAGEFHSILPGDVFLYAPGQEQHYGQETSQPFGNYWVHFTGGGASEVMASAGLSNRTIVHAGTDIEFVALFERMITEIQQKRSGYELVSAALLMQIIALVGRADDAEERGRQVGSRAIVEGAIAYIQRNLDSHISIASLAKMSHLSANQFSYLFKVHAGQSPRDYIIGLRLQKACELMRHTTLNIRQISKLCGFDDPLYFSRLFRTRFGQAPTDYIARMKEDDARRE